MQHRLLILFLFVCQIAIGQITSLNTGLQWFDKADQPVVDAFFTGNGYKLLDQKDSSGFHLLHYSPVNTETGVQPHAYLFLSDSAVEMLSFETYNLNDYKSITAQLKGQHFKSLGANVNGNFITTVYDNDRFLLNQDYEAVENPLGKGQISYYRYRIYRKNGPFDELNGEKTVMFMENGASYVGIRENYKNGVLSGERTYYYPNGTIKRKENYQAGRLNGLASDYNEEGKLTHSCTHSYHWKYGMEKWYNAEGKVVKTLQWQRDLPVGTEKQTFNGTVVTSIPYVKGVKQGLAKIPIYYDDYMEANYPLDTLNDEPFAIENVDYSNGLKEGRAVCLYYNEPDTMYVAHYKAGKLDSTFTRYNQYGVWYSTCFANNLENGTRTYRIPSGPLKDTIYKIEHYKNNVMDGLAEQFYRKIPGQLLQDPDPGIHLQGTISGYPKTVNENWVKNYTFETFKDGVRNGPYSFGMDSLNYCKGTYANASPDGIQETGMAIRGKQIRTRGNYNKGIQTGEWITEYVTDSVVLIENYLNNKKEGIETKTVKGQLVEERFYQEGKLEEMKFFKNGMDYCELVLAAEKDGTLSITQTLKNADTVQFFTYLIHEHEFPKSDTALAAASAFLKDSESFMMYYNGPFKVDTKDYQQTGTLLGKIPTGKMSILHKKEEVTETIEFLNAEPSAFLYMSSGSQPYSGVFTSAYSNETISVKDGLRNGWCIQYDKTGKEISKTKYVKGIPKKVIQNTGE